MPSQSFSRADLSKIAQVRRDLLGARMLPTLTFHSKTAGWEYWHSHNEKLIRLRAVPGDGDYLAAAPEHESDLCIRFLDVIGRQMLYPSLSGKFAGLRKGIHNFGTSLAKIDHFVLQHRQGRLSPISQFAETELEYLLITSRSMFDLFQALFAAFWKRVRLTSNLVTPTSALPATFSQLLLEKKEVLRSAEQLVQKYGLPDQIAASLASVGVFFQQIRRSRDLLVHHGHRLPLIFEADRGLALPASTDQFAAFGVWRRASFLPNDLASLRPVLAYIAWQTIASFDSVIGALEDTIQLGPDPVPGLHLFTRGWHTEALRRYSKVDPETPWWY